MDKSNNTLSCTLSTIQEVEENTREDNIQEISESTSNNITNILVLESDIINEIIDNIIDKLNIGNQLTRIKILYLLGKFINKKSDFLYDEENKIIIGVKLIPEEVFKLTRELAQNILKDKNLVIKSGIHNKKTTKGSFLKKNQDIKSTILKHITELERELYNIEASIYKLEDKGLSTLKKELEKSTIKNSIKQEESRIIELDVVIGLTISTISKLDQELSKLKEEEENISFNSNEIIELLSFSKEYVSHSSKSKESVFESTGFLNIGKKGKKIILGLSIIAGFSIYIKTANEIPEDMKISETFTSSISLDRQVLEKEKLERNRVEKLASVFPKHITGLEKYKVIDVKKGGYGLIYKGNTSDKDIFLLEINIYYIKNGKEIIDNRGFYFYRKKLSSNEYCMIIKTIDDNIGIIGNI